MNEVPIELRRADGASADPIHAAPTGTHPHAATTPESGPWWQRGVVYEIYPRSFADADGDGIGDLRGITARLGHLADLGVDGVWIAPWYPSPMADGGYDVTDYCDIHPTLGTLADADALLAEARRLGLRVILDVVANHTSEQHPWFIEALAAAPGSAARGRYLFRPGLGPNGDQPPNNWCSAFGGPAWTRVPRTDGPDGPETAGGEWYLHTFAPQQPDLDWTNSDVVEHLDDALRFWMDRGVDGFRLDAVPAMAKTPGLPDATTAAAHDGAQGPWLNDTHWDVDGVHEIMRHWRRLIDERPGDQVLVAEAVVRHPERLTNYLRADELHLAFNFDYVHAAWEYDELRRVVTETLESQRAVSGPPTWAFSSHDETRHLTRFGSTRRARAAVLLTLALPGAVYLYQGEELGLPEVLDLPEELRQDPVFHRSGGQVPGRDGCRVPLPWSGQLPPFGFSPTPSRPPWLPQPEAWAALTVEAQADDPHSMLTLYRRALRLRSELPDLGTDMLAWVDLGEDVLAFRRGDSLTCAVNLGAGPIVVPGRPVLTSDPDLGDRLQIDGAVWFTT